MPTEPATINRALIVNDETIDRSRQIASGEEAVNFAGDGIQVVHRAAVPPTTADTAYALGNLWLDTFTDTCYQLIHLDNGPPVTAVWKILGDAVSLSVLKIASWYNDASQVVSATSTVLFQVSAWSHAFASMTAGEVTINVAGTYWVETDVSGQSAGNRNYSNVYVEKFSGGAWAEVPGSRAILGGGGTNLGSTASIRGCPAAYAVGNKLRIRAIKLDGANLNILAQGCRLTVKEVR